mgnify:FL=1
MFVDIHTHILSGIDDGPETDEQMFELLKALYDDGIGTICCTPHCHLGYYGKNYDEVAECFFRLEAYIQKNGLDMQIFLGNELHYSQGCFDWIEEGICRTINGTRYVLVDFDMEEEYKTFEFAVRTFLHEGYIPVLAHVERYPCFERKKSLIHQLRSMGAVIQVNASSILRKRKQPLVKRLLRYGDVDVIASDTHDLKIRPPLMRAAYQEVSHKYGKEYADKLFVVNPNNILESVQQEE